MPSRIDPRPPATHPERPPALVDASRVRVNQVLGYYRKRGAISVDGEHRITVHDREVLKRRVR